MTAVVGTSTFIRETLPKLSIIGSWRDTLPDADVLRMLREYNAGRPTLHRAL